MRGSRRASHLRHRGVFPPTSCRLVSFRYRDLCQAACDRRALSSGDAFAEIVVVAASSLQTFRTRDCFCCVEAELQARLDNADGPEASALGARCALVSLFAVLFLLKKNRFQKQLRIRGPRQVPGEESVQFRLCWACKYGVQRIGFRLLKRLGGSLEYERGVGKVAAFNIEAKARIDRFSNPSARACVNSFSLPATGDVLEVWLSLEASLVPCCL